MKKGFNIQSGPNSALRTLLLVLVSVYGICRLNHETKLWIAFAELLFFFACTRMQPRQEEAAVPRKRNCAVLAGLFACFSLAGHYLSGGQGYLIKLRNPDELLTAFLGLAGYGILYDFFLRFLFALLDRVFRPENAGRRETDRTLLEQPPVSAYGRLLIRCPFLTSFLTLFILYLPYTVASYPAIFMGDVIKTLRQGFQLIPLDAHQPPVYTLLFTGFLKAGYSLFHSWNGAVFLIALIQMAGVFCVLSYGNWILIRNGVRWQWVAALLGYNVLSPIVSNYMLLLTKDVWYIVFFYLWMIGFSLTVLKGRSGKRSLAAAAGATGMLLFRNESILLLVFSYLLLAAFSKKQRKQVLLPLAGTVLCYGVLTFWLYPMLGVREKGPDNATRADLYSIPFQQTARTVLMHRDQITTEEEAAILNVFSFRSLEEMGQAYTPEYGSDTIKNEFDLDSSSGEVKEYFRIWKEMGKRFPASYLLAYVESYYQYFDPDTSLWNYSYDWSRGIIDWTEYYVSPHVEVRFEYPHSLDRFRDAYVNHRSLFCSYPPFSLLNSAGLIVWAMLAWAVWLAEKKHRLLLKLMIPMGLVFLFCLFSPCNGYYGRYQYPLFMGFPWIVTISACRLCRSQSEKKSPV
ncbi:MAG: hypothetical protein II845_04195 [Oscillospiraceae bacterium]|nr:hypothetical protein [Oscillospiraceae bacterium]